MNKKMAVWSLFFGLVLTPGLPQVLTLSQVQVLTPRSYPFILLLFQFCSNCPASIFVSEQTSICLKYHHSQSKPENIWKEKEKKKNTVTVFFHHQKSNHHTTFKIPSPHLCQTNIRKPFVNTHETTCIKPPKGSSHATTHWKANAAILIND